MPKGDRLPDREFYQRKFRDICEVASPLVVTFRLLDVAADKIPAWLPDSDLLGQGLGLQGVRLYHIDPVQQVVDAQLDALAELADDYKLRILIPFLVRMEEFEYWVTQVRQRVPAHGKTAAWPRLSSSCRR